MSNFKQLLQSSLKSKDTEEWLDVYFTRPIGLVFALLWNKLGIHPNVITILSIFLGMAAGYCFYFTDLAHNLLGIAFLMMANFCDSTDGQMARLSGKTSLLGRVLDGFSGDVWFFCIYFALCMRMQSQPIPGLTVEWGVWIWLLAALAGLVCHKFQASLSDYYRQIHLYFLKGKAGSELDNYAQQRALYEAQPKSAWFNRAFYYNYSRYCQQQERRTPAFQQFFSRFKSRYTTPQSAPLEMREKFLAGSRPLMKYTNMLSFNLRALCIYVTCLLGCPWLYFLIEITILNLIYIYMHRKHELLCTQMMEDLQ
ncbi:MAG: CDP-alcohol phosphatidyltransferase family protein [Prevotella sp.]|jgi:phosphatidylglycerophosphate synthase|nr:CDP-alcohol phosphatidyltransferase family protein [Prevotella sp.]MCI1282535.1 CDP-alcohol phosphatidyltransferase family protein [Prevotella sp.]